MQAYIVYPSILKIQICDDGDSAGDRIYVELFVIAEGITSTKEGVADTGRGIGRVRSYRCHMGIVGAMLKTANHDITFTKSDLLMSET